MEDPNAIPAIVAEVDEAPASIAAGLQESQLAAFDRRIRDLEAAIGDLRSATAPGVQASATAAGLPGSRKTVPTAVPYRATAMEAGSLDAALSSLSIEQRIAVKSGMLRAGLL